jgi:hypothetical protein
MLEISASLLGFSGGAVLFCASCKMREEFNFTCFGKVEYATLFLYEKRAYLSYAGLRIRKCHGTV